MLVRNYSELSYVGLVYLAFRGDFSWQGRHLPLLLTSNQGGVVRLFKDFRVANEAGAGV